MILFDTAIKEGRAAGDIVIDPFEEKHLGSNSYDVRLAPILRCYDLALPHSGVLDMRSNNRSFEVTIPDSGLVLIPGLLYLGSTVETIGTRAKYVPHIEGRSSVGRLGIAVHVTAGFGDVGFIGTFTLELFVIHPVRVYAGERVAQAYFLEGKGTPNQLYAGKYAGYSGPVASKMNEDDR